MTPIKFSSKPLKIGIDCRMFSSAFTGIGRYTYELTRQLFEIDQTNEYILFFNPPEFEKFTPPNPRIKKVLVNARHYSFAEQTIFLQKLLRENLDLMHFTHFNAPILYFKPCVVTIHDLTLSFFPGRKMTSTLHRAAYHITLRAAVTKAKHIIAVSNYTKKDLQKLFKISDEKITVTYEGVNQKFCPLPQEEIQKITQKYIPTVTSYILYTGVWRSHKNVTALIKAFYLLKEKENLDIKLLITGREDPCYPEIRELAKQLNLENDIIFTGIVDDTELPALYSGARAYIFPSLYEGFGLPPLEAMQCGTPVATSRASSIPEICGEENALYFDPYDINDIARKIHQICTDETLRQKLIENGLNHVKKFSWKQMAAETLEIYNHVTLSLPARRGESNHDVLRQVVDTGRTPHGMA